MGMVSSWRSRDGYVAGPDQSEENQLGGGASTVQQYLAAGLVDGFDLHVVPVVLGAGERLLESVGDLPARAGPRDRGSRRDAHQVPRSPVSRRAGRPRP